VGFGIPTLSLLDDSRRFGVASVSYLYFLCYTYLLDI
jgi:hypothetical protein